MDLSGYLVGNRTTMRTLFLAALLTPMPVLAQTPGNALDLDGSNDLVSTSLPSVFSNIAANDFTMEAWVRSEGNAFSRIIFAQGSSSNFANISVATDQTIYFYVVAGSSYSVQTDNALAPGVWTHVAATWEASTQTLQVYFDGIPQTGSGGGGSTNAGSNVLTLGSRPDGFQYLNGELDEVRIWDHVRSECDIVAAKNSPLTGTENGLVVYYDFNEGTPGGNNAGLTQLPDLTGNGFDGVLSGFALNGGTSNWIGSGALIDQNTPTPIGSSLSVTICDGQTYEFNGQQLDMAGVYTEIFTAANGCDSIVELTLGVAQIDLSVVQQGDSLIAQEPGAQVQWVDCANGFAEVPGATDAVFVPSSGGSYAAVVSSNGCQDTTACTTVVIAGLTDLQAYAGARLLTRPEGSGHILVLGQVPEATRAAVFAADGSLVMPWAAVRTDRFQVDLSGRAPGVYLLRLEGREGVRTWSLVRR